MGIAEAYLVAGGQYARYDVATNQMDPGLGYPKAVADGGPNGGWALQGTPMEFGFDTAMDDGYGKVLFFRDDLCLRADNRTRAVDRGLLTIADAFPGLADVGMASGLTAFANWLDERAYVVQGATCVGCDLTRQEVLWGPTPLATEFEGLAEAGFAEPRALTAWPGASAYKVYFDVEVYMQLSGLDELIG